MDRIVEIAGHENLLDITFLFKVAYQQVVHPLGNVYILAILKQKKSTACYERMACLLAEC